MQMQMQEESPYITHVFVCINDRAGERQSCADEDSRLIKDRLKEIVKEKGWKGRVRISTSGCMGLCELGPNVMIYPQKIWFREVFPENMEEIVAEIERIMENDGG